ncbi:MFS transporter [Xenorhabdus doucetiae]|uniref:EmrB/QacA subfamily drug resistance transporter n=1 Tax=Xenorhabdus doucetiae TaxID=351671 RepID=A0A068QM53_9GAMM|nr:MFS transporter [Xenorhabdus doucetiae]TYP02862.1 EmrB/QacA subfamily drug resistance transporter [Xenorhabdus doucetiae]CDG15917.1 putative Drug transporter [Xenorhabdus doucetiae]
MTYRYRIALIFLLGFFIDCVNIFMSAIALPDIANQMSVSESHVAWVANSYILGLTLIIPISSWLAERFGTRQIMSVSMLLFSLAALFSGLAENFYSLIGWRFVQGLGGGLIIPVGQALTFSLFKQHERAKISTLVMSVALIAPAISPSLGGAIVDHYSWRWVFLSNIPFSLLASILSFIWLGNNEKIVARKPDLKGLLLVSLVLVCLLVGLSAYADSTSQWLPFIALFCGGLFTVFYIRHYRHVQDAILDLAIMKNTRMCFSVWIYHAIPGVFTGVNLLNIFYLQQQLGWSAEKTGSLMILYAVGAFGAILVCGKVYNRLGAYRLFLCGLILHAVGIALLSTINHSHDLFGLVAAYLLMGIGGGIGANTAQTTALIDFAGEQLSRASVIWNLNRQISFSIGAALFTMIFNVLQQKFISTYAYHLTFVLAAILGLLPLIGLNQLKKRVEKVCKRNEN